MTRFVFLSFFTFVIVNAINRPVYKINLTQKGYAQFIEYNVDTPPLREFTICAWIRVYDLDSDQRIFTYVTKGNNRVVRLWLERGGQVLKVSINGVKITSVPVSIVKDVWRHICLSYQSDYGAWALYVDSRLAYCEATQANYGYVLPRGGSVIIGYGTADSGISNGFEGEIFGVNMILISTIERNVTIRQDPSFEQKPFKKNKVKRVEENKTKYVVLSDLQPDEIHNNFEKIVTTPHMDTDKTFRNIKPPFNYFDNKVGSMTQNSKKQYSSEDKEILTFNSSDQSDTHTEKTDLWNIEKENIAKSTETPFSSGNKDFTWSTISEYESPPPPTTKLSNEYENFSKHIKQLSGTDLPDFETAPPINSNNKVYGQWTSSKYAGSVLSYLKSINFQQKDKNIVRIPKTIQLAKVSDSYPYASDFKSQRLRPPSQFSRRYLVERHSSNRDPQINVQILEEDLRSQVIKMLAQTRPKHVDITNRGESNKQTDHRFYRSANYNTDEKLQGYNSRPLIKSSDSLNNHWYTDKILIPSQKHVSVLPFIKYLENMVNENDNRESQDVATTKDMYSKSLSLGNKWHNIKSYNNDYTPRRINEASMESAELKKYPAVRLKYKYKKDIVEEEDNPNILHARQLINEATNSPPEQIDSIYLLKFNHGYLPSHDKKNMRSIEKNNVKERKSPSTFDRHIKIGNALNERHILDGDVNQTKKSFEGGIETIPDINRYRSESGDVNIETKRPNPEQRHCMNVELYDRFLYIQPDESIDMTHILSPVRKKNWAIDFILQNYKKCSLSESLIEKNSMLLIDWSTTPVRLFGGAYPRTTTDLCGFF